MMFFLRCFSLYLFFCFSANAQSPFFFVHGEPRQGEMLFIHVTPGSIVHVDEERIALRKDGWFVIGIGRDDTGEMTLAAEQKGKKHVRTLKISPRKWDIQKVDGVPQNTVTPNEEEQERIRNEGKAVTDARAKYVMQPFPLCFVMPAVGRISGIYGSQRIFNGIPGNQHNALDIANKTGTPIYAPADGIVLLTQNNTLLSGNVVLLGHGQNVTTSYIHMSKILVKTGQKVKKGDKIGLIGMTGRATGPHLHWTVMWQDKRVDPQVFVKNAAAFCPEENSGTDKERSTK